MNSRISKAEESEPKSACWFVYIIETDQHKLYTGITTNPERRFQEHLDTANGIAKAKGAKYFRTARPHKIIYREEFNSRSAATKRETEIKALGRTAKLGLIATNKKSTS